MKIVPWINPDQQMAQLGKNHWSVPRLFELARKLPVMNIPLDHLNVYQVYTKLTLREFVTHMQAVIDADPAFPIILDEDGELMDGRHRIMRAMWKGDATVRAVRFDENPSPCRRDEDE